MLTPTLPSSTSPPAHPPPLPLAAVLIVASFFPPVHFGFLCAPHLRLFYLATTTLLGASMGRTCAGGWRGRRTHVGPARAEHAHAPAARGGGRRRAASRAGPVPAPSANPAPLGPLPPCPLLAGLCTLCVTLMSAFQRPEFQTYRALLFVSLGLWGIVPMLHGW